jgi:hypothetical protein
MRERRLRRFAVLCALAAFTGTASLSVSALASTPTLTWQGATKLQVLCILADYSKHRLERQQALCERIRTLASEGSPLPVELISAGDPAVLAADAATLLVHASVEGDRDPPVLAFSLRVHRVAALAESPLFGAAPRAVALADTAALDAALQSALSQTLPWLFRPSGPRPLS